MACVPISESDGGSTVVKLRHLKKADEISSVFDFKCRISSKHFIVLGKPNHLKGPRLVVMVGKKTHRHAVHRNYMRRVSQEYCRTHIAKLGTLDIVIRVIKPFIKPEFSKIILELEMGITGLSKCRDY